MRGDDFKSPSGTAVTVKREPSGERYNITFTPDQLGFYTLGAPKPVCAFGINTSAAEADLRPVVDYIGWHYQILHERSIPRCRATVKNRKRRELANSRSVVVVPRRGLVAVVGDHHAAPERTAGEDVATIPGGVAARTPV